jgi:hypothetical protein
MPGFDIRVVIITAQGRDVGVDNRFFSFRYGSIIDVSKK